MFKLDQKGISLPIVLAVAAIIGANSYYFLLAQRNATTDTAIVRTDLREDAEARRIAAALSDFTVCTANFGGQSLAILKDTSNPLASPITSITKSGTIIVQKGTDFKNNTGSPSFNSNVAYVTGGPEQSLKVGRIYLSEIPNADTTLPRQVRLSLRIDYDVLGSNIVQANGKKVVVSIPLYIEFDKPDTAPLVIPDDRKIVRCYARPDNAMTSVGLFDAIKASCLPDGTGSTKLSNTGCEHLMTPTDCTINGYEFLNGVGINTTTHAIEYTCGKFTNTSTAIVTNCSTGMVAKSVKDSVIQCEYPDPCTGGGTLVKKSGGGFSCLQACPVNDVWNSTPTTSGDGTSNCYHRDLTCPTGTYAKSVSPAGVPDCQPIAVKDKACTASEFATHFDSTSSTGNLLHCAGFTKPRVCPTMPKFSYISALNDGTTPTCMTMN